MDVQSKSPVFTRWLNISALLATILSTVIALYLVLGINKDPREELALKGIPWSYSSFINALSEHDEVIVALFSEAGMKLRRSDFNRFIYHYLTPSIGATLLEHDSVSGGICPTDYENLFIYTEFRGELFKYEYIKRLCDTSVVKNGVLETLTYENEQKSQVEKYNTLRDGKIQSCLSELKSVPINEFYKEVIETYTPTQIVENTPRQYVISEIGISLLTSSKEINRNPSKFILDKINVACESHYPKKKYDQDRIVHINDALSMFSI
ncbi:hypothetical protein LRP49_04920 [Enterovibrio sp. ZSDZ35]|uniref:Uncharacterized protein n=1 Tax=Enterovibrio qingdaonensis TaxID=2899818 RepID=A0ABT5QIU4_9GAMM|nr:hypothetical protein [Enterovibrio sp. ZSDZ35]MDD1780539.1 hypothetical protein [Enterovibrio sp. ZSDZ35]